jgi:ABC-type branched-subunit amino acid transport system substrate-binding protein/tRNA A-37 threonylcarbamoyl transferase component Bud32
MGTVYLGLAEGPAGFNKLKVVKQLRPDLASESQFLQMFLEEARLAAQLNHPNVVQTFEVGFDGQRFCIEMEYLEGQSLDAIARYFRKHDKVPHVALSVWTLAQVLAGLDYAHELKDMSGQPLRIVHRDVSPHNVIVTYDGAVKVLDFGIAKAAGSSVETRSGVVKGKATYMAPEQAARRDVDRRADVFAVGVMLWELLVGQRFWGELSDGEIFLKLTAGEFESPRSVRPEVPEELDAICMRALAKNPDDRYASASDMQVALEDWLAGCGTRVGARQMSALMNELFASKRMAARTEIEAQVARADAPSFAEVPVALANQSGNHASMQGISQAMLAALAAQSAQHLMGPAEPLDNGAMGDALTRSVRTLQRSSGAQAASVPPENRDSGNTRTGGIMVDVSPPTERSNVPKKRRGFGILAVVASVSLVVAGAEGMNWIHGRRAAAAAATAAAGPPAECKVDADCVPRLGTSDVTCRSDGQCAALKSDDCQPVAASDGPKIRFGVMLPLKGPMADYFGRAAANALELASRDFERAGGLPAATPEGTPRQIQLVMCDDSVDYMRAAKHLAEIETPVVMGFGSSQESIDAASHVFLRKGTMVFDIVTTNPLVTRLPQPTGPRLLWRPSTSADQVGEALAHVISDYLEPLIRRQASGIGDTGKVKVAVVRAKSSIDVPAALVTNLRINGKSLVENGDYFRQYNYRVESGAVAPEDAKTIIGQLDLFAPNVIVYVDGERFQSAFLEEVERGWPAAAPRPYYASAGILEGPSLFKFVGKNADRRHRFYSVTLPANTPANLKFTLHYNETFDPKITVGTAPGTQYDAFYLAAYAAATTGDAERVTGKDLAAGLLRIRRGGIPMAIEPSAILDAIRALRAGRSVALDGAGSQLDLDPETGEDPTDFAIYCLNTDDKGFAADGIESGIRFDHRSKSLETERGAAGVFRMSAGADTSPSAVTPLSCP